MSNINRQWSQILQKSYVDKILWEEPKENKTLLKHDVSVGQKADI